MMKRLLELISESGIVPLSWLFDSERCRSSGSPPMASGIGPEIELWCNNLWKKTPRPRSNLRIPASRTDERKVRSTIEQGLQIAQPPQLPDRRRECAGEAHVLQLSASRREKPCMSPENFKQGTARKGLVNGAAVRTVSQYGRRNR